jgi:hypothetical protein
VRRNVDHETSFIHGEKMKNFTKTFLAASTCLFLAVPSYGFELSGKVTVSIRNVSVGNGVFAPVARLTDSSGSHQDIKVGEQGLTTAILYNREALSAWVTTQLPVATSADGTPMVPIEIVEEEAPKVDVEVEDDADTVTCVFPGILNQAGDGCDQPDQSNLLL